LDPVLDGPPAPEPEAVAVLWSAAAAADVDEPPGPRSESPLSMRLMPKAHLSNIGLEPRLLEGEGSGCEPVMKMPSRLGV